MMIHHLAYLFLSLRMPPQDLLRSRFSRQGPTRLLLGALTPPVANQIARFLFLVSPSVRFLHSKGFLSRLANRVARWSVFRPSRTLAHYL